MTNDEWTEQGSRVTDEGFLDAIRRTIEEESSVIIEHRFYRGGRSPHRFVCDQFAALLEYINSETGPGDALWFWRFDECCLDGNAAASGKIPDKEGRIPRAGAY